MLEREQVARTHLHPEPSGEEKTGSKDGQCRGWWHQLLVFQKELFWWALVTAPLCIPAGSRAVS